MSMNYEDFTPRFLTEAVDKIAAFREKIRTRAENANLENAAIAR